MGIDPEILELWRDDALLVVNKPAGLPTLVDGYDPAEPYLLGLLKESFGPLWVVHRLDRETSGVIVFARNAEAHRALNGQFEKHQAQKVYHALVGGSPEWTEKTVRLPLRTNGDRKHRSVVDVRRGKAAETQLRVLRRFGAFSLMQAIPRTGRTHQIRVHLATQGCPVIADALYGDGRHLFLSDLKPDYKGGKEETPLLSRLGLHAWSLLLFHPSRNQELRFEAPYPADFATALKYLNKFKG